RPPVLQERRSPGRRQLPGDGPLVRALRRRSRDVASLLPGPRRDVSWSRHDDETLRARVAFGGRTVSRLRGRSRRDLLLQQRQSAVRCRARGSEDRKSTRLNSSHVAISYAVFCLKKKNNVNTPTQK